MSESSPQPNIKGPKPRHPLERALVWGGILVLLALVIVEYVSRRSYAQVFDALTKKVEDVDKAEGNVAIYGADVQAAVGDKKPARVEDLVASNKMLASGAVRLEVYSWFTLNPFHSRDIFVYYGITHPDNANGPEVLAVQNTEEEASPLPVAEMELMLKAQEVQKKARLEGKEKNLKGFVSIPDSAGGAQGGGGRGGGMGMGMGMPGMPGGGGKKGPASGRPGSGKKAEAKKSAEADNDADGAKDAKAEKAKADDDAGEADKQSDADKPGDNKVADEKTDDESPAGDDADDKAADDKSADDKADAKGDADSDSESESDS